MSSKFSITLTNLSLKDEINLWNKNIYYISYLVRALWLFNLADRTLLYGLLKIKVVSVAKLLHDLSPKVLNLFSK